MPSIVPLPVFEAEADPATRLSKSDQEIYDSLESPKTLVIKFGRMQNVAEYVYDGDATPGCGTKVVARTQRGTELAEMLTTTCINSGCSKSVSRNEMLDYIENSGGKDFPFHTNGRVMRIATVEDLNANSELENLRREAVKVCKRLIADHNLPMKLVEAEPILGKELLTFYYMSEDRVDFRDLVKELAAEFKTRIEMRQVGARDEARLVADYERCGQHCCCKNFLKVLKPISMKSAKLQKATLDPLKISGRCGRLMCCLRYEDQTYKELKANLPHRKSRVGTSEGPGIVVDTKILAQLALVRLEHDDRELAFPIEELMDPDECPDPVKLAAERLAAAEAETRRATGDPLRGLSPDDVKKRSDDKKRRGKGRGRGRGKGRSKAEQQDAYREKSQEAEAREGTPGQQKRRPRKSEGEGQGKEKGRGGSRKKRGKRRRGGAAGSGQAGAEGRAPKTGGEGKGPDGGPKAPGGSGEGGGPRRKRRRRGRGRGRGKGPSGGNDGGSSGGGGGGGGGGE